MAKLYWRVKKNGKWTWIAVTMHNTFNFYKLNDVDYYSEEEEELPVCEHCGSILAHPCDCQLYMGEEE